MLQQATSGVPEPVPDGLGIRFCGGGGTVSSAGTSKPERNYLSQPSQPPTRTPREERPGFLARGYSGVPCGGGTVQTRRRTALCSRSPASITRADHGEDSSFVTPALYRGKIHPNSILLPLFQKHNPTPVHCSDAALAFLRLLPAERAAESDGDHPPNPHCLRCLAA